MTHRLAICAVLVVGCKASPRAVVVDPGCPSERFIEALHAAAFYFQHGPPDRARDALQQARALSARDPDPVSMTLLSQLSEISRRIEGDPSWAHSETERVRMTFGEWACVTAPMHQRFHDKLPPIP